MIYRHIWTHVDEVIDIPIYLITTFKIHISNFLSVRLTRAQPLDGGVAEEEEEQLEKAGHPSC